MAKEWYPIINYTDCDKCGKCIEVCPNDVYDKSKAPSPAGSKPENCKEGCKDCAEICPQDAIILFGDEDELEQCSCCSCSNDSGYRGC